MRKDSKRALNIISKLQTTGKRIKSAFQNEKSSKVVGRAIKNIKLPPGTTIGAIVRGSEVLIAHSNTLIHEEDHVILFLVNKRYIGDVEKLFQVSAIYF